MKILALMGSPRKQGNTDVLLDEFLKGSQSRGHKFDKMYLYDMQLTPCVDCRVCKSGELICKVKDDMQKLYPLIDKADLIVYATPLYWWGPTGPMKIVMDRIRPYVANKKIKGKKAVVIVPSGEEPTASRWLMGMFKDSFDYLNMQLVGSVLVKAYEKGEVKQDAAALKQAYDLGASL